VTVKSSPQSAYCVNWHSYCTVQLSLRIGDQWNGVSVNSIHNVFFPKVLLKSYSKTSTQYCFSLGIVFNTHRLTINVAQFTVVSESSKKGYGANVLWVSRSRLIPHVIDPQSIGKAVQWNKYAPKAILKYNTSSVISTDCQINKLLILYNIPTAFSMIYSIMA
jgi:hypothetical protein